MDMEFEITATLTLHLTRTVKAPSMRAALDTAREENEPIDLTQVEWEQSGGNVDGWDLDDSAEPVVQYAAPAGCDPVTWQASECSEHGTGFTAITGRAWAPHDAAPDDVAAIVRAVQMKDYPRATLNSWTHAGDTVHAVRTTITLVEAIEAADWSEQDWDQLLIERIIDPEMRGYFTSANEKITDSFEGEDVWDQLLHLAQQVASGQEKPIEVVCG